MELQILISKKGTKVVTSSNLYDALQLPLHKYNATVEKWLTDVYGFKDDVRQPLLMKDYAERKFKYRKQKDYYISIEMAKLITLNSNSDVKQKYAKWLLSLEEKVGNAELLTKEQIIAVIELTKVMGLVSCQESAEKQHLNVISNDDTSYQWWQYRANLLGYSANKLRKEMVKIGKTYTGKTLRQMLICIDKFEIIRMAVIDLFMALGKSKDYACNMGDLAKVFAKEMNITIWDDRDAAINFSHNNINLELMRDVQSFNRTGQLAVW